MNFLCFAPVLREAPDGATKAFHLELHLSHQIGVNMPIEYRMMPATTPQPESDTAIIKVTYLRAKEQEKTEEPPGTLAPHQGAHLEPHRDPPSSESRSHKQT